jgi:hypothetical protein
LAHHLTITIKLTEKAMKIKTTAILLAACLPTITLADVPYCGAGANKKPCPIQKVVNTTQFLLLTPYKDFGTVFFGEKAINAYIYRYNSSTARFEYTGQMIPPFGGPVDVQTYPAQGVSPPSPSIMVGPSPNAPQDAITGITYSGPDPLSSPVSIVRYIQTDAYRPDCHVLSDNCVGFPDGSNPPPGENKPSKSRIKLITPR